VSRVDDPATEAAKMSEHARRTPMGVRSPCVSVCRMDPATGWCEGCYRTIEEIAGWGSMPAQERLRIWTELHGRKAAAAARHAGEGTRP
jgi:uncharacterized protein